MTEKNGSWKTNFTCDQMQHKDGEVECRITLFNHSILIPGDKSLIDLLESGDKSLIDLFRQPICMMK